MKVYLYIIPYFIKLINIIRRPPFLYTIGEVYTIKYNYHHDILSKLKTAFILIDLVFVASASALTAQHCTALLGAYTISTVLLYLLSCFYITALHCWARTLSVQNYYTLIVLLYLSLVVTCNTEIAG